MTGFRVADKSVEENLTDTNLKYRTDLQGLRAIAILLVMFSHAGFSLFQGGFIGVDVFFVISGYLITGILFSELQKNNKIRYIDFYSRRFKRLLPALICMLAGITAVAIWALSAIEARDQLASGPFAATWTSNIYFAFRTIDYFNEIAKKDLFLHTWSLGVEAQFYIIWPAILTLLFKMEKKFQNKKRKNTIFIFGTGFLFFTSFVVSIYGTSKFPVSTYYLTPSRIWQLSLGSIVYIFSETYLDSYKNFSKKYAYYITLTLGLSFIFCSALLISPNLAYPGYWALLPSLGSALVILSGNFYNEKQPRPLQHPLSVWIGDFSYSLYLWHWPVFILGFSLKIGDQSLSAYFLIIFTILISFLSYFFVEKPFWKGKFRKIKSEHFVIASILIIVSSIIFFHFLQKNIDIKIKKDETIYRSRTDVPVIYQKGCDTWFKSDKPEPCFFGNDSALKTVVLFGDSIGAQWFSILPEIFPSPTWRIIVLTKSACPIVDENIFYQRIGKIYKVCTDWRNSSIEEIEKIRPDIVFIGSSSKYDFNEKQWTQGSARIFKRLSESARKIIVIPGTPSLEFDGPSCVAQYLTRKGQVDSTACQSRPSMHTVKIVTDYLTQASADTPKVHVVNFNDIVCPNDSCSAISSNGTIVFRDSQHLTDTYIKSITPAIKKQIKKYLEDTNN